MGALRGAALEPIERTLPRVGAPVLVIRADGDRLSTLAWAQRLAALAPDGRLARLPGSVPYWALFGTRPSLDRLTAYLSRSAKYDEIRLTIFPHGVESIGLPGVGEWQAVLASARQHGQLLAVDPGRYPRHFRALTGFHRELSRLPRVPATPPLRWETAKQYLAPTTSRSDLQDLKMVELTVVLAAVDSPISN